MLRLGRWLPVVTIVALLAAAMVATIYANPRFDAAPGAVSTDEPPPREIQEQPSRDPVPLEDPAQNPRAMLPPWVAVVLATLCTLVVVGLVIALLWSRLARRMERRRQVLEVADPEEVRRRVQASVRAAVDEGLADLDIADSDPRRAVIACWVRLEAAAAAAGTERAAGDTSTDLVERVLAEHAVTPQVLAGLAEVYREARFAPHVVDESMREQARAALIQLRDELSSSPATTEPA